MNRPWQVGTSFTSSQVKLRGLRNPWTPWKPSLSHAVVQSRDARENARGSYP
jgi:hypothetical protein